MRRTVAILLAILVPQLGCAGLVLRDSDSGGAKAAKVLTRLVLAVPTLGFSELGVASAKNSELFAANVAGYQAKIDECRRNAMYATSESERVFWAAEYDRWVRDFENYMASVRAQQAAQAAAMRQAGQALQQSGASLMEQGFQQNTPADETVRCETYERFGRIYTECR